MTKIFQKDDLVLYKRRLSSMHGNIDIIKNCPNLFITNHLMGELACQTCGNGKHVKSARGARIRTFARSRMYVYLGFSSDLPKLHFILQRWPNAMTNIEFPIPEITYSSITKCALAYDEKSNTIIDVYTLGKAKAIYTYHAQTSAKLLTAAGFNYVAFDGDFTEMVRAKAPVPRRVDVSVMFSELRGALLNVLNVEDV